MYIETKMDDSRESLTPIRFARGRPRFVTKYKQIVDAFEPETPEELRDAVIFIEKQMRLLAVIDFAEEEVGRARTERSSR